MPTASSFLMDSAWPQGARRAIHIRGAPNLRPMMEAIAEDFMAEHPDVAVAIEGGFTYRGFKGVIDGTADLGMIAASLPRELKKVADDRGVALVHTPIALDGVVVIVHPGAPVRDLTINQLRTIYSGHYTDWSAVGGSKGRIVPFSQPPYVSSYEEFSHSVMGEAVLTPKAQVAESRMIVSRVAQMPGAIGYVSASYVDDRVRAISINGVAATPETLRSGKYPLRRELALVMRKGGPELADRLVRYVLDPDKGQRHAHRSGAIPLVGGGA